MAALKNPTVGRVFRSDSCGLIRLDVESFSEIQDAQGRNATQMQSMLVGLLENGSMGGAADCVSGPRTTLGRGAQPVRLR